MSTELKPVKDRNGKVLLTQFSGGEKDGVCISILPKETFLSLTKLQAIELSQALEMWAHGLWPEENENG